MLAQGPIERIAELVASQPGALRNAIVGPVLKIWEPDFIASASPDGLVKGSLGEKKGIELMK